MLFALEKSRRNKLHPREVRLDNDDRLLRRSIVSQVQTMLTLLDMILLAHFVFAICGAGSVSVSMVSLLSRSGTYTSSGTPVNQHGDALNSLHMLDAKMGVYQAHKDTTISVRAEVRLWMKVRVGME